MMFIAMPDVKEAERLSKAQRIAAGRCLRVDETKVTSPKDMMPSPHPRGSGGARRGVRTHAQRYGREPAV
jgi:hypothetical protein